LKRTASSNISKYLRIPSGKNAGIHGTSQTGQPVKRKQNISDGLHTPVKNMIVWSRWHNRTDCVH